MLLCHHSFGNAYLGLKKIDNSNKLDRKYLARFEKNNVRMIKKQDGTTIPLSLLGQDPL
jgi:hypothetical protein